MFRSFFCHRYDAPNPGLELLAGLPSPASPSTALGIKDFCPNSGRVCTSNAWPFSLLSLGLSYSPHPSPPEFTRNCLALFTLVTRVFSLRAAGCRFFTRLSTPFLPLPFLRPRPSHPCRSFKNARGLLLTGRAPDSRPIRPPLW